MHKARWGFTHAEWVRLGGFGAAILFLHIVGWGLLVAYARKHAGASHAAAPCFTFHFPKASVSW